MPEPALRDGRFFDRCLRQQDQTKANLTILDQSPAKGIVDFRSLRSPFGGTFGIFHSLGNDLLFNVLLKNDITMTGYSDTPQWHAAARRKAVNLVQRFTEATGHCNFTAQQRSDSIVRCAARRTLLQTQRSMRPAQQDALNVDQVPPLHPKGPALRSG